MAAANTDKLRKHKSTFSTTLSGGISDSDTTIGLNSASGLPTDTAVTMTIDRVDSNGDTLGAQVERVIGVISGSNLTNALRGQDGTSAQSHSSGAVVEGIFSADEWNDLIDHLLAEHNQDGTHKDINVDSIAGNSEPFKMGASYDDWNAEADGATVTFDLANGNRQSVTLTDNRTIAFSNFTAGAVIMLTIIQDGSGGHTVTWPAAVDWAGATAPTLSTGANDVDTFIFIKRGTDIYGYELGLDMS